MTTDKKRELMNLSESNDFTDSESESDTETETDSDTESKILSQEEQITTEVEAQQAINVKLDSEKKIKLDKIKLKLCLDKIIIKQKKIHSNEFDDWVTIDLDLDYPKQMM